MGLTGKEMLMIGVPTLLLASRRAAARGSSSRLSDCRTSGYFVEGSLAGYILRAAWPLRPVVSAASSRSETARRRTAVASLGQDR